MKCSDSIAEIAKAIATLRKNIAQPTKDANNPFFKSKYVQLEGVVKAIDEALPEGLAYVQEAVSVDKGVAVSTIILHSSGEYMQFDPLTVPVSKHDAQAFGSAETYARRYTLSAVFGVTSEVDDDGNAAVGNEHATATANGRKISKPSGSVKPATDNQTEQIKELLKEIGDAGSRSLEEMTKFYEDRFEFSMNSLNESKARQVIKALTGVLEKLNSQPVKTV